MKPNFDNDDRHDIIEWANEASREDLIESIAALQAKRQRIEMALSDARSAAAATGVYSDRGWFQRAISASRITGSTIQQLQAIIARRRKDWAAENVAKDDAMWKRVARDLLDAETFQRLQNEVIDRQELAGALATKPEVVSTRTEVIRAHRAPLGI